MREPGTAFQPPILLPTIASLPRKAVRPTFPAGLILLSLFLTVGCGCGAPQDQKEPDPEETAATETPAVSATEDSIRVLAAPRFAEGPLAQGRRLADRGQWAAAADALATGIEDADLSGDDLHAARMLLGFCQLEADRFAEAHDTLAPVAESDYVLADYASVLGSHAAHGAERYEAALTLARSVDPDSPLHSWSQMVQGIVLLDQDKPAEAIKALAPHHEDAEGKLQRKGRLALARAYVETGEKKTALQGYELVVKDHGKTREGRIASKELEALRAELGVEQDEDSEEVEPFERAKRLYRAHRSEKAIKAFQKALENEDPKKKVTTRWCEGTYLIGKSYSKLRRHAESAPYFVAVIERCPEGELHRNALYNAGRAFWNADRQADAISQFRTLIDTYPEHSYADDAFLFIARIQFEVGDDAGAEKTLRKQLSTYPDGDMAPDGHWLLFSELYRSGRLQEAIDYVEENEPQAGEDDLYSMGRLAYFRARSLEKLKMKEDAVDAFEKVVQRFPLSYYALLAFARLKDHDPERASSLAHTLRSGPYKPERDFVRLEPAALARDASFQRGLELIRLGLVAWAQDELERAASRFEQDESLQWSMTALYDVAGAHPRSHRMAARMTTDTPEWFGDETRAHWVLAYPRPFLDLVDPAAEKNSLVTELVYSIMREESGFEPQIESWANARGLMQLMLPTARSVAPLAGVASPDPEDLFIPEQAIPLGAAYLGKLGRQYGNHPVFIIAGYNGGQGNLNRWLSERGDLSLDLWVETIPFGQTRHYTKRVLTTFWRYTWLYSEDDAILSIDPAVTAAEAAQYE